MAIEQLEYLGWELLGKERQEDGRRCVLAGSCGICLGAGTVLASVRWQTPFWMEIRACPSFVCGHCPDRAGLAAGAPGLAANAPGLAANIKKYLSDRELMKSNSEKGRKIAAGFDYDIVRKQHEDFYRKIGFIK